MFQCIFTKGNPLSIFRNLKGFCCHQGSLYTKAPSVTFPRLAVIFRDMKYSSCVLDEVYKTILLSSSCTGLFPKIPKCVVCLKRRSTMIYAIFLHSKSPGPLIDDLRNFSTL